MSSTLQLAVALPELTLAIGAMALLMVGVATRKEQADLILWLAVLVLALAGFFVLRGEGTATLFGDSFIVDPLARVMKLLTLIGAAVTLIMSIDFWQAEGRLKFELPVLVLLATTGMLMMISANDLIALYVGLELQSLSLYVVAAFDRRSARSSEAGIKYFVLGALSSGMLLYGASLIYGFTGSTLFSDISAAVQPSGANLGLIFGLVFLITGFAFKISAVPFHMWTPDVYEGAPTPVTAFFAAAPKLAAMALTVRTLFAAFPSVTPEWQQIVTFLAIASMALGAFAAIGQRNIKRLMAYSSIGHTGYALVGLAAGSAEGVQGVIIYLAIYLAMTLGTFACILAMRRNAQDGGGHRPALGAIEHKPDDGLPARDVALLARRHPAARGLLRQVLCVPRRHQRRSLRARRHRRAAQRGGCLLLSSHRQDHVFRRSRRAVRADARAARRRARGERPFHSVLFRLSGTACDYRRGRCQIPVLMPPFVSSSPKLPAGYRLLRLETVDSTNAEARRRGEAGEPGPLWIWSLRQSAGRGRNGRQWQSQHGNLFVSLLIGLNCPLGTAAQLALLAGVVAYDTAAKLLPREARSELLLKWPNDVLLKGGKVAGMLLESASEAAPNRCKVVIGTGFNLATFPPDLEQPATSLRRPWQCGDAGRRLRDTRCCHRRLADTLGRGGVLPDGAARLARPCWPHRAPVARAAPWRRGGRNLCRARFRGCAQASDERWCRAPHRRRRRVFRHFVTNPQALA